MEWSMARSGDVVLSAAIPVVRFFGRNTGEISALASSSGAIKSRLEIRACAESLHSNAGDSGGRGSNPRRQSMFSDRIQDFGQHQQDFHPADGFKSTGSRSISSRPSIPGRFSKYSKNDRFRPLSSPTKNPPKPALPSLSSSRGFSTSSSSSLETPSQAMPPLDPGTSSTALAGSHWSIKHLDEAKHTPRVRPPYLPREHLEIPVPKHPNRLQQGFASRGIRSEPVQERPVYDLPFEFQYSYSEIPKAEPIAQRGPQFSPFGPESMPRPWTGKKPLPPSKKRRYEIDSFNPPPPDLKGVKPVEPAGPFLDGQRPILATTREEIIGEPLTPEEISDLIVACNKEHRQINLGRDGLTHNMLDVIHNHWKRRRVIKCRCKGVPTIDMDNVCFHLEDKTGGKIIQRHGGSIYLFRGRNYNPRYRPHIPLMLWKPPVPVYPRLIPQCPGGISVEHADYLRRRGRRVKPLTRLSRNGVYLNLAKTVKAAFEVDELVKIDCQGMNSSDIRKIGAKLKELLGIFLLSFEHESILMWRGHPKPTEDEQATKQFIYQSAFDGLEDEAKRDDGGPPQNLALLRAAQDLENLWERAINFGMITTLEDDQLDPDTIKSLAGTPPKVRRETAPAEKEEAPVFEVLDRKQRKREEDYYKKLAAPLPPEPSVGVLPVDELAKLLASPK